MRSLINKFLFLLCLMPVLVLAALPAWHIVPNESSINFTATQNNVPIKGQFKKFTGEINFDQTQLDKSNARIVVDMNSVATSYGQVADTLKLSDWFDVKKFPQAVFKSNKFTKTGDKAYQADGVLTIRNKTVPVKLNFVLEEQTQDKTRIKGSTVLKRTQFGVGQGEWEKTDNVKDDVTVDFVLVAMK